MYLYLNFVKVLLIHILSFVLAKLTVYFMTMYRHYMTCLSDYLAHESLISKSGEEGKD